MSLSKRKLVDWAMVFLYVALIYSTLSMAPRFSIFFGRLLGRGYALSINILILALVFTLLFINHNRLKKRPILAYFAILAVICAYAFMVFEWTNIPAEKLHLLEYGFLSFLLLRALGEVRPRFKRYAYIILSVAVIGYVDELIQFFLPNRVYQMKDAVLNVISGILGLIMAELL